MKKTAALVSLIVLVLLLSFSYFVSVAFSSVIWSQTYGGEGTQTVASMIETADGGFALFGITGPFEHHPDLLLIKTDTNGIMQWNQTYGMINSKGEENVDNANCILQTLDGGYLLAGNTEIYASGNSDIWLIRTDDHGNMIWNRTYDYQLFHDRVNSIVETSDAGYILGGTTYSTVGELEDFYIIKIDSYGNLMWNKTYGTPDRDFGESIVETSDGGYVLGGDSWSLSNGTSAYQLLKIDSLGNLEWNQIFGWNQTFGRYSEFKVNDLVKTSDGGFALGGTIRNRVSLDFEYLLIKTDELGNMQWNQTYGNARSDGTSLIQNSHGELVFTSTSNFGETKSDVWLIKTDLDGNIKLNQTYLLVDRQEISSLVETSDGGYVFAGQTFTDSGEGDFWLFQTDLNGIPEFPSWTILVSGLSIVLVLSIIYRTKVEKDV